MTKTKKLWLCLIAVITVLLATVICLPKKASAAHADSKLIEITQITTVFDIKADRTMHVTEEFLITYKGTQNTGFQRWLPVNAGDRVRNLAVKVKDSENASYDTSYPYDVELEQASGSLVDDIYTLVISITDGKIKPYNSSQYFFIEYDYEITKPRNKNAIYLNVVGYDIPYTICKADITLNLPDGFERALMYVGYTQDGEAVSAVDGTIHKVLTDANGIGHGKGVTVDLFFADGVLSTRFDFVPYIVVIIGCVILAVLFALKFLVFNKNAITPVVNFTAPDDMDPLVMGKLIDNKVNAEDVTSLIYYWANKGYIQINLENQKNPEFIRIAKQLPTDAPSHQKIMYNDLFAAGDLVTISSLENKFYRTVEKVTRDVNAKHRGLYSSKSLGVSILFALIGAMIICVSPIILALATISPKLFLFPCLIMIIPSFIIYALTESLMYNRQKMEQKHFILCIVGIIVLCAAFSTIYALVLPGAVMEFAAILIACFIGFATIMLSVLLITRTEDYTKQLNQIIGFRNFIVRTEKERLEVMLEEDPQLYYNILPYAQILNVTNIWENKFKSLTITPPSWATGSTFGTYVEISIINSMLRSTNTMMRNKMVSRPSSSGTSGGGAGRFGGGSFGGHGGGGHGGGGARGI